MNTRRLAALVLALGFVPLASCIEEGEGTFLYQVRNTRISAASNTPVLIRERWLVFLGDELTTGPGGTVMNADADRADRIPVVVDMAARRENRSNIAAREVAILGNELFMVVDETEDARIWNNDGDQNDLVLLKAPLANPSNATFVDELETAGVGPRIVATLSGGLFYMEAADLADPLVAPETSLNVIRLNAGLAGAPTRLANRDASNTARPFLVGQDGGMVFCVLDETVEQRILNADGEQADAFVLALVNSEDASPQVASTGLAMASGAAPLRALKVSTTDWVVAFLVDETAQGVASLNNYTGAFASWRPSHCTGNDTDNTDQVLHFVRYGQFLTGEAPINTGFAGLDRVLISRTGSTTWVATIVPETADGNCLAGDGGLNDDDDADDRVLRWISVRDQASLGSDFVYKNVQGLIALANTAGGTRGATDLGGRFIAVVDEAADERSYDGVAGTDNTLIGWLDPSAGASAQWTFDHNAGAAGFQGAGARWMGEQPDRTRVGAGFQESVFGNRINARDTDTTDSVPTFVRFDPGNASDLDFPGPAIAIDEDNAGIVTGAGIALFRVDENADNFDWNSDGDRNDFVLFRTRVTTLADTLAVSTLNSLSAPAAFFDLGLGQGATAIGAAFLADESAISAGNARDLNADGDTNDLVLRWMRVGP
jgi:hypothetical protein